MDLREYRKILQFAEKIIVLKNLSTIFIENAQPGAVIRVK